MDRVAGSRWILAGGLAPGSLYRIDARTRHVDDLLGLMRFKWNRRLYPACSGRLNRAGLLSHGVAIDPTGKRFYVVNHGAREAIEIFAIRIHDAAPTWVGCVPLPQDIGANSVAALPDDAFAVTNFGPATPAGFQAITEGLPTGDVRTWSPRKGWQTVPGSQGSGPNGILADTKGDTLFVARSGTRDIIRINLRTGRMLATSARLPIMPDNLRWRDKPGSSLVVTGMKVDPAATLRCFSEPACRPPGAVITLSTDKLASSLVAELPAGVGGPATTALAVGSTFWLGSFRSNRIDIVTPRS
jgi:hypothetical protein